MKGPEAQAWTEETTATQEVQALIAVSVLPEVQEWVVETTAVPQAQDLEVVVSEVPVVQD